MSESASLTVKMGLDGKPLKDGLNNAKADVRSFAQSFNNELHQTRGAVKDVAGTIENMSRAFDGSIQGAVGGFKDAVGLLKTSPMLGLGGILAGIVTGIATSTLKATEEAKEKLGKSIEEFKKLKKEAEDIDKRISKKERDADRPESPSRSAIEFAREELKISEELYQKEIQRNEEMNKRKVLAVAARDEIKRMMDSFGIDSNQAFWNLIGQNAGQRATGMSEAMQRENLKSMGFSGDWTKEVLDQALSFGKNDENALEKSIRDVKSAKEKVVDAKIKVDDEVKAYDKKRLSENEESTKAAYDKERKAEEDRLKLMADGHKEAAELARKNGEELEKIEEQAAERRREIWKKEAEDKASAMQDAADEMSRLETSGGSFSSRYSADQYARVGGQIGGTSNMRELREAERQAAILEKGNEIQAKMLNRLEKIESQVSKAMDDTQ